jgi:hypothetical protein
MFKTLVKRWANKNTGIQWPPCMTLIQSFVSMTLISHRMESLAYILNSHIGEGRRITLTALKNHDFP